MKFKVDDVLFSRFGEKNQKGRKILMAIENRGLWKMPSYKFECKTIKSGITWCPEWLLYTEAEFVQEIKGGTLLAMQTRLL